MRFVPVIDKTRKVLMPTSSAKARRLVKSKQATPFWNHGVFCIRLNYAVDRAYTQTVAVGIDPGSKKEGFTVKSEAHTYLNVQADAVTWVKRRMKQRREMRRNRRSRKTPCRQPRFNRAKSKNWLAPSTKARWQWKLRIAAWLSRMFPIDCFVVEDIKAVSKKGQPRWNISFGPLEVGKHWFYEELKKIAHVETKQGYETYELRKQLGLRKSSKKLSNVFEAHCVDSWVLADYWTGGDGIVDNKEMLLITPLQFHRRQLHYLRTSKAAVRKPYGSTQSCGFKRGSLVKHLKWGLCYVGGTSKGRVTLHGPKTGNRLCRNAKPNDLKFLTFNSWRVRPTAG